MQAAPSSPNVDGVDGWTPGRSGSPASHMDQVSRTSSAVLQPDNSVTLGNLGGPISEASCSGQDRLEQAVVIAPHKPENPLFARAMPARRAAAMVSRAGALHQRVGSNNLRQWTPCVTAPLHSCNAMRWMRFGRLPVGVGTGPRHAATWRNLGLIERERGALPASVAAYDEALALEPCSAETPAHRPRLHPPADGRLRQRLEGLCLALAKPTVRTAGANQAPARLGGARLARSNGLAAQ